MIFQRHHQHCSGVEGVQVGTGVYIFLPRPLGPPRCAVGRLVWFWLVLGCWMVCHLSFVASYCGTVDTSSKWYYAERPKWYYTELPCRPVQAVMLAVGLCSRIILAKQQLHSGTCTPWGTGSGCARQEHRGFCGCARVNSLLQRIVPPRQAMEHHVQMCAFIGIRQTPIRLLSDAHQTPIRRLSDTYVLPANCDSRLRKVCWLTLLFK